MDNAELHVGVRIYRFDGIAQAGKSIAAHDEHVRDTAGLEVVENFEPETRAFGFFNPQAQHLLPAVRADAECIS